MLRDRNESTGFFLHLVFKAFALVLLDLGFTFHFLGFIRVVAPCRLREVVLDVVLVVLFFFTIELFVLSVVLLCVLLSRDVMSALVISFILIIAFLIEVISIRIIEIPCRHYIEVELIIVTLVFSTNLIFTQSYAL